MTGSWDPVWETIFSTREWGKYPPEELIRFTARSFYRAPDRRQIRLLDAGCGPGACCWYLAREGFSVTGFDGSPTALQKGRERLEADHLTAEWVKGDLLQLPFPEASFDGAIDIAAIQQNRAASIQKILAGIAQVLKPGGRFFSMMLASGSWGDGTGTCLEPRTYTGIPDGPYQGEGITHFAVEEELRSWLAPFRELNLELSTRTYENRSHEVRHWIITATR